MAQDPRVKFTVKPCIRSQVPIAYAQNAKASGQYQGPPEDNFLGIKQNPFTNIDALGKIGDIELLNDIGLGTVGKGLRALSSLSNTVRRGEGNNTSIISAGVNGVLSAVGLNADQLSILKDFDPNSLNTAVGNAKQIYELVSQGNLSLQNVPAIVSQLMRAEQLARSIVGTGPNIAYGVPEGKMVEKCSASAYAMDLVSLHPKYKNLFVIQFIVQDGTVFDALKDQGGLLKPVQFIVKKTTRPNVSFTAEDVNMYNYRTKVITKTEYQEMDLAFIDDQKNYSTQFFKLLLEYFSPASKIPNANSHEWEDTGMTFSGNSSASFGALPGTRPTIFSEFILYHVYGWGQFVNKYHFHNPKITALNFDEVDMYSAEGNEVSMKFAYDSVHIETGLVMDGPDAKVSSMTDIGAHPLRNNDPAAVSSASRSGGSRGASSGGLGNWIAGAVDSAGNFISATAENISDFFSPTNGIPTDANGNLQFDDAVGGTEFPTDAGGNLQFDDYPTAVSYTTYDDPDFADT